MRPRPIALALCAAIGALPGCSVLFPFEDAGREGVGGDGDGDADADADADGDGDCGACSGCLCVSDGDNATQESAIPARLDADPTCCTAIEGTLEGSGAQEWYSLPVFEGEYVALSLCAHQTGFAMEVNLYDATPDPPREIDRRAARDVQCDSLRHQVASDGEYLIRVANTPPIAGAYTVTLSFTGR